MLACFLLFVFSVLSGFYTMQLWMCDEGFKLNSEVKGIEDWKSWNFLSNFHPSYSSFSLSRNKHGTKKYI